MNYLKYAFTVPKEKKIRVITNTDVKNEADDQFAIVQALLSPKFDHVGMIAAHFGSKRSSTSMEDSYQELRYLFDLMKVNPSILYRGASEALPDENTPVTSPGAELIIKEALREDSRPLFITFLGPLTDLASALLLEPKIQGRFTAVWIGGGAYPDGGSEYNLSNDIHAANVVFKSTIDLWQIPKNVYQTMLVSLAELELRVRSQGALGKYLFDQLAEHALTPVARNSKLRSGEAWILGDSPAFGVLLAEHDFRFQMIPAPRIYPDMSYGHEGKNRSIRVYHDIDPRFVLEDFYAKLTLFSQGLTQ